jgi:anaerobic selenocysteine-containing dehydrogenase
MTPTASPSASIKGYCPLCVSRCGIVSVVEDGRLVAVEPDPDHPTGASVCVKGRAAPAMVHAPERLTTPLMRTRPKGDGDPGWQPIGWDVALAMVARALTRIKVHHGAEAVAFAVGTPSGTALGDAFGWIHRLANAFGSPNMLFATENCNWHRDFGAALTIGSGIGMPDFERAQTILLWGINPAVTWPAMAARVLAAKARGARLIVVDPRRTGLAGRADHWLGLRPGTDGPLALALAGELIRNGWHDADFVRDWTTGFEQTAPACLAWTPERAQTVTGITADAIRATARQIGQGGPVAWYSWTGTCHHADATQLSRALNILYALTGWWDRPGGNRLFAKPPLADIMGRELLDAAQRAKTLGLAERPLGPPAKGWITSRDLIQAVLTDDPYAVRGLVSFGGNPLLSKPALPHHAQALTALDFFVHADMVMTPTAQLADLVLPVASPWEREGLQAGFLVDEAAESLLQLRAKVIEPVGQCRSDTRMVFDMARALGLEQHFFGADPEAGLAYALAPTGISADQLRQQPGGIALAARSAPAAYQAKGFNTQSGKIELYSEMLARAGQPPLPDFAAMAEDPAFPLILATAKWPSFCHSQFRHIEPLVRRNPEPVAEMNPADAAARGLADGDPIVIETPVARARCRLRLSSDLIAGTVMAQYGWWPENLNAAMDGLIFDAPSGSNPLKSGRCQVRMDLEGGPRVQDPGG